jgi:hypothetical protein
LFGGELRAAIGVGRAGLVLLGKNGFSGRTGLCSDRGQKDETLDLGALRRLGEADRGLGVEQAVVVLRNAGHCRSETRGMDDGVHARERFAHVVRPREIADDGAGAALGQCLGAPQQHAQAIAALGQFLQKIAADEARGAGQRNERFVRRLLDSRPYAHADPP